MKRQKQINDTRLKQLGQVYKTSGLRTPACMQEGLSSPIGTKTPGLKQSPAISTKY